MDLCLSISLNILSILNLTEGLVLNIKLMKVIDSPIHFLAACLHPPFFSFVQFLVGQPTHVPGWTVHQAM